MTNIENKQIWNLQGSLEDSFFPLIKTMQVEKFLLVETPNLLC